jgi:glycosyltransferase involved in cell wall biosynthesis
MIEFGTDVSASKQLFRDLGIPENTYRYIKPVSKIELISLYNEVDVVLDQFMLGSWGIATPEAMACEKPVIMYYDKVAVARCFGDEPPVLNSYTPEEIRKSMELCLDEGFRQELGKKARAWVQKKHDPDMVVDRHLSFIKEMME